MTALLVVVGAILGGLAIVVATFLFAARRNFAIRRRNCCGKGCGCLFPKKID